MDLITLAVMRRTIAPIGAKHSILQSIPFNTCAIATNVTQDISDRLDGFPLLESHLWRPTRSCATHLSGVPPDFTSMKRPVSVSRLTYVLFGGL